MNGQEPVDLGAVKADLRRIHDPVWYQQANSRMHGYVIALSAEVASLRVQVAAVEAVLDKAEAHPGSYAFSLFMDDDEGQDAPKAALIGTRVVRAALAGGAGQGERG